MGKPRERQVVVEIEKGRVARVVVEGKEVSLTKVQNIHFSMDAGGIPTLTLEYGCWDQMTLGGGMIVEHVCPRSARYG